MAATPVARAAAALALAALALPVAAQGGPKGTRALEICAEALEERYRATVTGGVNVKESNNRHWVRGNAESEEAGMAFRFRCMAYYGSVRSLEVLEQRSGLGVTGSDWVAAPPPVAFPEDPEEPEETETAAVDEDAVPEEEEAVEPDPIAGRNPVLGDYDPDDWESYEADEGVVCLIERRACYELATGLIDRAWTLREFPAN